MSYIPFPDISPEIFSLQVGPITLALRWYALAYIVGLIAGWKLIVQILTTPRLWQGPAPMPPEAVERLLTWVIFGLPMMLPIAGTALESISHSRLTLFGLVTSSA